MSNLNDIDKLKIYLLRLSQCACDDDVDHFIKYMYRSDLSERVKKMFYPLCVTLRYYYQKSSSHSSCSPFSSPSSSPSSSPFSSPSSPPSSSPSSL